MKKSSFIIVVLALFGLNEAMGQWNTNGTHIYNSNSGNVGIGISSPGYLLHVSKNMTAPSIRIHNAGGIGGAAFEMVDNNSGANWKFKATNAGGFKIRDHANGLDVIQVEPNSAANRIYIKTGGNIGIGTNSPLSKLHIEDVDLGLQSSHLVNEHIIIEDYDGGLGLYSENNGNYGSVICLGEMDAGDLNNKWGLYRTTSIANPANQLRFSFGPNAAYHANPTRLAISHDGKVGIGTTSPSSKLEVAGTIHSTSGGFKFPDGTTQNTAAAIPTGVILMWSGPLANIPAGWALCDGTNGTPDLRNRFVTGTAEGEDPGVTGGNGTHHHLFDPPSYPTGGSSINMLVSIGLPMEVALSGHTHDFDMPETPTSLASSFPPYYKLAYIMKQ